MSTSGETRQQGFAKIGKPKKPEKEEKINMSPHDMRNQRFQADREDHNKMVNQFNDDHKKGQCMSDCKEDDVQKMAMKSQAQRAFLHINEPELAKEFEEKTPKGKKLPYKVKK
jgi:hypothetical protein